MFLNSHICAVYPAGSVVVVEIENCVLPAVSPPRALLSSLSVSTWIFAINTGYVKCTSVHLRSTGILSLSLLISVSGLGL